MSSPVLGSQPQATLVQVPPPPAPLVNNLLIMVDNESPGATSWRSARSPTTVS